MELVNDNTDFSLSYQAFNDGVSGLEASIESILRDIEGLTGALESIEKISESYESMSGVGIEETSIALDLIDIALAGTSVGVEDIYPATIDKIEANGKADTRGLFKKAIDYIIKLISDAWQKIVELWENATSFTKGARNYIKATREKIATLKREKVTAPKKISVSPSLAINTGSSYDNKLRVIPATRIEDVQAGAEALTKVSSVLSNDFSPSILSAMITLANGINDKNNELDASSLSNRAANDINFKALSGIFNASSFGNIWLNLHAFVTPLLPNRTLIVIGIPTKVTSLSDTDAFGGIRSRVVSADRPQLIGDVEMVVPSLSQLEMLLKQVESTLVSVDRLYNTTLYRSARRQLEILKKDSNNITVLRDRVAVKKASENLAKLAMFSTSIMSGFWMSAKGGVYSLLKYADTMTKAYTVNE